MFSFFNTSLKTVTLKNGLVTEFDNNSKILKKNILQKAFA